ncbi:MAG: hypothetical protein ACI8W8_000492 [Rhodothermales bacterium]|jgi:hypothetical protein
MRLCILGVALCFPTFAWIELHLHMRAYYIVGTPIDFTLTCENTGPEAVTVGFDARTGHGLKISCFGESGEAAVLFPIYIASFSRASRM